jgi:hypothetical protein
MVVDITVLKWDIRTMNKWCMGEEILVDRAMAIALIPSMIHDGQSTLTFINSCKDTEFIVYRRVLDNGNIVVLDIRRV